MNDPIGRGQRPWTLAMVLVCACAFVVALWIGRNGFFVWDEYSYWTERYQLLHQHHFLDYLMREHVGHWIAVPMLLWAPIQQVFGLESYLPYVIPTVLAHCVAGFAMFSLLSGRARLPKPLALGTAALYLSLGSAAANVCFGWQVGLVIPIACVLLAIEMLDRYAEDPLRRFAPGVVLLLLLVALTSSGIGITAAFVVTVFALLRRRFAVGIGLFVATAVPYLVWRAVYKPFTMPIDLSHLHSYVSYVTDGLQNSVEGIFQIQQPIVAWMLLVGALGSVLARCRQHDRSWPIYAAPMLGALFFYATLATQRATLDPGSFAANQGRYIHIASALLLPSFGSLAAHALRLPTRRWIALGLSGLLAWCVIANLREFVRTTDFNVAVSQPIRAEVEATPVLGTRLDLVPGTVAPYGAPAFGLTVGTVRGLARDGVLPCRLDYDAVLRVAYKLGVEPPPRAEARCPDSRAAWISPRPIALTTQGTTMSRVSSRAVVASKPRRRFAFSTEGTWRPHRLTHLMNCSGVPNQHLDPATTTRDASVSGGEQMR